MFNNYLFIGHEYNWVHHNIYLCLTHICQKLNHNIQITNKTDLLPSHLIKKFHSQTQTKFIDLYYNFAEVAKTYSTQDRKKFIYIFRLQNKIEQMLCNPSFWVNRNLKNIQKLIDATAPITEYGFDILTNKTIGTRQAHYNFIYQKNNYCPFCGLALFNKITVHNEDYDHYLSKEKFPLAAANLLNLIPMCQACNERHKLTQNIISDRGFFRKAFYPYGKKRADISLLNSTLFKLDGTPDWDIRFTPNCAESVTWDQVFHIKLRYKDTVLEKRYTKFLDKITEMFKMFGITSSSVDEEIINCLDLNIAPLIEADRQPGITFIDCKIVELFKMNISTNPAILLMLRSGL
ncbi:hypothetical protein [Acinetobacter bereziniae]|uniref:hypothetical protein n=1 Tax=Acinetobacter bereziniae TaxID=106648 RepID=UPI00073E9800|nr:hypothetical protein [Acinetobacter bereziniae]RSZ28077.1 hypothetical protein NDM229_019940 [Acinetobacter bereziniae]